MRIEVLKVPRRWDMGTWEWGQWGRDQGGSYAPSKKFRFWISDMRILVHTWCFLFSSPKAGLNAVPTVKITFGTPFTGVPAGNKNDP